MSAGANAAPEPDAASLDFPGQFGTPLSSCYFDVGLDPGPCFAKVIPARATRAGMGISTPPCLYADPVADLVHNARVRAFMDFFGAALEQKQPLLAGDKT